MVDINAQWRISFNNFWNLYILIIIGKYLGLSVCTYVAYLSRDSGPTEILFTLVFPPVWHILNMALQSTWQNYQLSWHAITPDWEGLYCFWQAKYPLFSLAQKRMCWVGGWKFRAHPIFCLQERQLIWNDKESVHVNVTL